MCALLALPILLFLTASLGAQTPRSSSTLPDAPDAVQIGVQASVEAGTLAKVQTGPGTGSQPLPGTIRGIVKDPNGNNVPGATVMLTSDAESDPHVSALDDDGNFSFAKVSPGAFKLTVTAPGLANSLTTGNLDAGQTLDLAPISLRVATATTDVEVHASTVEIAAAQVKLEEKQRVLGVFPNFYAVYIWNAAPLTPRQKFGLAWKSSIDPVNFALTGVTAGIEQASDGFSGYGQGAQGYAKRYGSAYADGFIGGMIGGAILPTLLHQDPRYFVMGRGSVRKRALYAIAAVVICKGDNGHWQPNYSNVVGNLASASISNLYYPASDRDAAGLTLENSIIGTASGAAANLIQEFFLRKMTPHVPNYGAGSNKD